MTIKAYLPWILQYFTKHMNNVRTSQPMIRCAHKKYLFLALLYNYAVSELWVVCGCDIDVVWLINVRGSTAYLRYRRPWGAGRLVGSRPWGCCDRKSRAACAQSFAPWQFFPKPMGKLLWRETFLQNLEIVLLLTNIYHNTFWWLL